MNNPHTTMVTEVTLNGVPRVGWANIDAHFRAHVVWERPNAFCREDGRGTECGCGLLLALETVAAKDGQWLGRRGVKGDSATLALDLGVHADGALISG
jgi:hypothetical protein